MKDIISTKRQLRLPIQLEDGISQSHILNQVPIDFSFPTEQANQLAEREAFNKHLYRPNTYLHKWWARRSGTTFRHILKQLCNDPQKQDYYASGGLEGMIILDPMIGGGTTIHEAIRLGARVVGFDIDPIPVLQAKASLEYIPLEEKQVIFDQLLTELSKSLDPLFVTHCPQCQTQSEVQFIFYGLRKRCACGEVLFVDSLTLREEPNKNNVQLCPYTGIPYVSEKPLIPEGSRRFIFEKGDQECPVCGTKFMEIRDVKFVDRYRILVITANCPQHAIFYKKPDNTDLQILENAKRCAAEVIKPPPEEMYVLGGPKSDDLLRRGIHDYQELFTPRQLIYLSESKKFLDALDAKHRRWLSLLISTSLEFNSFLCGYKGADKARAGAIRHVFSHHAYSFPYTALENNPLYSGETSGTIRLLFEDRIKSASEWSMAPVERKYVNNHWRKVTIEGETDLAEPAESIKELQRVEKSFFIVQQDSSKQPVPDNFVDHVVTDPPYFDSVQYSDLAHFFRVWLKWFMPDEATWDYSLTGSAAAESEQDGKKYQRIMTAIWKECNRVIKKPNGRLIFTFHHWRSEAWARLTLSLRDAAFRLVTAYTIQSENPISVHIRQLKALKHDSILVLQPFLGNTQPGAYSRIQKLDTEDSYAFCQGCAILLGYCLETDLTEKEIFTLWKDAIGE